MEIKEYQTIVSSLEKKYPENMKFPYIVLGIVGEATEFIEKMSTIMVDNTVGSFKETSKEIGDVLWYLAMWANENKIDLVDICENCDQNAPLLEYKTVKAEMQADPNINDSNLDTIVVDRENVARNLDMNLMGLMIPSIPLLSGRIAEIAKKALRDDQETISEGKFPQDKLEEINKNIGSLYCILQEVAEELGSMSEVLDENIKKLTSREERDTLGGSGDNR